MPVWLYFRDFVWQYLLPVKSDSQLTTQIVRSAYLLIYSQADLTIFPDRHSFAAAAYEIVMKCEGPTTKL